MKKSTGALLVTRFWARVHKTETCWLWTGALDSHGYGWIRADGRYVMVHRLVFEWAHGPLKRGQCVLHRCDVRNCIRLDHLIAGSHEDNMADMRAKRRQVHGERCHTAKLTREQVQAIRARCAAGDKNYAELGREHGVAGETIRAAVLGRSWHDA